MKGAISFAAMSTLAMAQNNKLFIPHKSHDLALWRQVPLLPQVFIQDHIRYIMFANDADEYVITVKGRIDNNNGLPIEADREHRVARGYFMQDATYGFDSLDGFVVYWDDDRDKWRFTSLTIRG